MSKTTLYAQIKQYLLEICSQNKNKPQFLLPSEHQLSIRFNCSRIPAKRALNELSESGIITRIPGRGSFINNSHLAFDSVFSTKTICMLLPDIDLKFSRQILNGVQDEVEREHATLFCAFSKDSQNSEKMLLDSSLSRLFDGLIVFSAINNTSSQQFQKLISKKMPFLFVARNDKKLNVSAVLCKDKIIIEMAVEALVKKGYYNIGIITTYSNLDDNYLKRIHAYEKCMHNIGVPEKSCLVEHYLLKTNPAKISEQIDDFFAANSNLNALIIQNYFIDFVTESKTFQKTAINEDSLIMIDEPEEESTLPFENILYIDQHPKKIGELAAQQIIKETNKLTTPREILLTPDFRIAKNSRKDHNPK